VTVATHVGDLADLVEERELERPALVGHSWGAMLALAFAAEYPELVGPIVLVGCGTFDDASRERFHEAVSVRLGPLRARIDALEREIADPDERIRAQGSLLLPAYSHEPVATGIVSARCDAKGYRETWSDMLRLQEEGTYPAAFSAIESPVLMIHGAQDPHPGAMIRASLAPHVPGLEYIELERCGHYPWLERHAREPFLRILGDWLERHAGA
jgi:pimeloyl-ACP methyl ester carboxylesterase